MPFKSTFVTAKMKVKQIDWLILCSLGLIWGSSFILMKRGLDAYTSEQVAALRIGLAAIALMPFHLKIKRPDFKKYWKGLILMGCFGNLIPAFLFTKAETQIDRDHRPIQPRGRRVRGQDLLLTQPRCPAR